jgi:hypothetical protein
MFHNGKRVHNSKNTYYRRDDLLKCFDCEEHELIYILDKIDFPPLCVPENYQVFTHNQVKSIGRKIENEKKRLSAIDTK